MATLAANSTQLRLLKARSRAQTYVADDAEVVACAECSRPSRSRPPLQALTQQNLGVPVNVREIVPHQSSFLRFLLALRSETQRDLRAAPSVPRAGGAVEGAQRRGGEDV